MKERKIKIKLSYRKLNALVLDINAQRKYLKSHIKFSKRRTRVREKGERD